MVTRSKPTGCCTPVAVAPLPAARSQQIVSLGKAFSDANRIEILRLLAGQQGAICACDIVEHLDLAQPTVSHHLKILKDAGLLESRRRGLWSFYSIDPAAAESLAAFGDLLDGHDPCCSEP